MRTLRWWVVIVCVAIAARPLFGAEKTTAIWSDGRQSVLSDEELIRYALTAPPVPYPDEARKTNATGSGLYEIRIDKAGTTTGVKIVKSSGSVLLDKTAATAFKKCRVKKARLRLLRGPVGLSVNAGPCGPL